MASVERGSEQLSPGEAHSLLQWWSDAGVDTLVDESPRDWLRPPPAPAPVAPHPTKPLSEPAESLPDQLDLFRTYLAENDQLPFAATAAPRICPAGDPGSGLMILTDMPSDADCSAGTILSGEAGILFDAMLAANGRDRGNIYLASLSCLRPPSGSFDAGSAARCATLALHHVGLVAPKAVLLLGDTCAKALLGLSVIQARGRWHALATHSGQIAALASFHPNYLLDQPAAKRHAWHDLQMLMERVAK